MIFPLPEKVCGIKVVETAATPGIPISNGGDSVDRVQWNELLDTVASCYDKIAKLPMSAFGRAHAASG